MPFKFGVRKACRYAVSSKSAYVVCVHMLDRPLMDCVLTFDSSGRECLENIAVRIGLNELEYFGLQYVDRRLQFRWVELDKPLKKQLDKRAQSPMLYFGVMFYISDILSINDPIAQYQYYIHLKADIIEGKLHCSPEQAVLFAAYAVQADFGDYDPQVHGTDYLNNCSLLPKTLASEETVYHQLLHEVVVMHQRLHGVPPLTAELQFVVEAQQLDDYGLEYYPVKDMSGTELRIGASFVGIFIRANGDQPTVYFKWSDIVGFSHSRKLFGIDTTLSEKPFQFQLDDADGAKYVFTMCKLQLAFYKSHVSQQTTLNSPGLLAIDSTQTVNAQQMADESCNQTMIIHDSLETSSHNELAAEQSVTEPAYVNITRNHSESQLQRVTGLHSNHGNASGYPSNGTLHGGGSAGGSSYLRSDACISDGSSVGAGGGNSGMIHPQVGTRSYEAVHQSHAAVPSYRPTPDYDAVMQQRMLVTARSQQPSCLHPDLLSYSQPEIYQPFVYHWNPAETVRSMAGSQQQHGRPVDRASSLVIHPLGGNGAAGRVEVVRHSSNVAASAAAVPVAGYNPYMFYRAPPPYPRQSSSTPDLASPTLTAGTVPGPPGILVRRQALAMQSEFDQSFENLAVDVNQLHMYAQQRPVGVDARCGVINNGSSTEFSSQEIRGSSEHSLPDVIRPAGSGLLSVNGGAGVNSVAGPWSQPGLPTELIMSQQEAEMLMTDLQQRGAGLRLEGYLLQNAPRDSSSFTASQNAADRSRSGEHFISLAPMQSRSGEQLAIINANQSRFGEPFVGMSADQNIFGDQFGGVGANQSRSGEQLNLSRGFGRGSGSSEHRSGALPDLGLVLSSLPEPPPYQHHRPNNSASCSAGSSSSSLSGRLAAVGNTDGRFITNVTHQQEQQVPRHVTADSRPCSALLIPPDDKKQALESKMESQLFAEFELIAKKRSKSECCIATLERNRERNRFKDVVPYDDNRVQLTPTKNNPDGFINASQIRVKVASEEFWHIATQAPLTNTVTDFWQMIWENNVAVVAMLMSSTATNAQDSDRQRYVQYWPNKLGPQHKLTFGDFEVTLRCSSGSSPYVTSGLLVRYVPAGKQRVVWHLQYTDWPDHGCPTNSHGFLDYLSEIEAIRRQVHDVDSAGVSSQLPVAPVVIHCSAGVGRTGVVILVEIMKASLERNQLLDVPVVLKSLRDQRMFMVQTVTQYCYVYKTLVAYLQSSRLI